MNWVKVGWGENYSPVMTEDSLLHVNFSEMKISDKSIDSVATAAIKKISEEYPEPYYLMASGGIDSQSMIWLWEQSGIPYEVISFKYVHNDVIYNSHDLVQLDEFSIKYNIPVTYKYFDPINFFENELLSYATKFQCTSPQICTHMKISEYLLDGTVIFSGDFGKHQGYTSTMFGLKRYADLTKRSFIPFFFLHDPELAGITRKYSIEAEIGSSMYAYKVASIQGSGIPVIPQLQKYTGFEKIKDYYDEQAHRISIRDRLHYSNMASRRVFDILFRYKLTDTIKYKDNIVYIW